jgi:hypothetical protein
VGYNETSKAYRVYIPKQRKTIVSRDVKFEEDFAFGKSHKPNLVVEDEEQEASKVEPGSLVPSTSVKRPRWFSQNLRDSQEHVQTPRITFRESKALLDYMALMSNILDSEPSSFQEVAYQQGLWREGSPKEREWTMRRHFLQLPGTLSLEKLCP